MTIVEAYDLLPLSEKTLLKHFTEYPFRLSNQAHPCEYYVIENDKPIGVVQYYKGKKLACFRFRD